MTYRGKAATVFVAVGLLFGAAQSAERAYPHDAIVRELLQRSRLLGDVRFEVPTGLYRRYLRDLSTAGRERPILPVSYIAETGTYRLTVGDNRETVLKAEIRLRVLDPKGSRNIPVLNAGLAWEGLAAGGKAEHLATSDGWLRFTAETAGLHTITARVRLGKSPPAGRTVNLNVLRTVRTFVVFDSPLAWDVRDDRAQARLVGSSKKGTYGRLALLPGDALGLRYRRPEARRDRPPRYRVQGDIAWNLDAAAEQVDASLNVTIAGGPSDRIELLLPESAEKVTVTGPEVRQVRPGRGTATVYLRGGVLGRTALNVSYELPPGKGDSRRFGRFGVAQGHWTGGTLVVTNTAGGSEILPETLTGLREIRLADIPASASSILRGPAVLGAAIVSREFSATVEVLQLGEFALRQSIADLAHYEVFVNRDGAVICRVRYELRNRNKQFLRLDLPEGSRVLLGLVNEKSRPISPIPGRPDGWLLGLERSRPSVIGLVSFPVEVVFICKIPPLGQTGVAEIPLPAIDLPVAYGWCRIYLPDGISVKEWSGPMKRVRRFSNETAKASLDYGWGALAAGYAEKSRPTAPAKAKPDRSSPAKFLSPTTTPAIVTKAIPVSQVLARNYYRAGKDYYDAGDYGNAAISLRQVIKLAPGSVRGANARRLLANAEMLSGRRRLKTRSERAAARVVRRELAQANLPLEREQEQLLEQAIEDVRAGKAAEARSKLAGAEAIGKQLLARHSDRGEIMARMREDVQPEMEMLRRQGENEARRLRGEMSRLKASGDYEKALSTARRLRDSGSYISAEYQGSPLQKEMLELAVASSRQRQRRLKDKKKQTPKRRKIVGLNDIRRSRMPRSSPLRYPDDWPGRTFEQERRDRPEVADSATGAEKPDESVTTFTYSYDGPMDTEDDLSGKTVTRDYDIRDLVVETPTFVAPGIDPADGNAASGPSGGAATRESISRKESARDILELVRSTVAPDSWSDGSGPTSMSEINGKIIVTQTAENQRAVEDFLDQLRQARGPQVQTGGGRIARQRAAGTLSQIESRSEVTASYGTGHEMGESLARNENFKEFVERNYGWTLDGGSAGDLGAYGVRIAQAQDDRKNRMSRRIVEKLERNLGQKVSVSSVNINVDADVAGQLGAGFVRGRNNVTWAVIDEAQYRSLMELDTAAWRLGRPVAPNDRRQETIVGTDARLANGWTVNVAFAGDRGNSLVVRGNSIALSHEDYLLIHNGRFLTVVRAGPMRHWTEKTADAQFVKVPQSIEIPRVGHLVKFEKILLDPTDRLALRAEYILKGASK